MYKQYPLYISCIQCFRDTVLLKTIYSIYKCKKGLTSLLLFSFCQVNDDLNERLKVKGINVVANVGFKSDPAEALYILKVRFSLAVFHVRKADQSSQLDFL